MALPHMPTSYTTRKNVYERAIVRRLTQEDDRQSKWKAHTSLTDSLQLKAYKQHDWTSDRSKADSMNAFTRNYEKDTKALNLKRRRRLLESLLSNERLAYEAELKGYSLDNYSRLDDMKHRAEELKSAKEEKRKQVADEKLYEHFRKNNPDLRQLESIQMKNSVVSEWSNQVEEKQEALERDKLQQAIYEEELRKANEAAAAEEERMFEKKKEDEKKLQVILRSQIRELSSREREAKELKIHQEELIKQQFELAEMKERMEMAERERKKQELGKSLLRQHTAHMRKKSKQIQKELEEDKKTLELLMIQEQRDLAVKSARKERARADAQWMKNVIEEQLRLEAEREAELDMLYQEEAARLWQKREDEWKREKEAREKLMGEVLGERQEQLVLQLEEVEARRNECLQEREALVKEMEQAHLLSQREKEQQEELKVMRKEELVGQMTSRRAEQWEAAKMALGEQKEEEAAQREYEELLRREAAAMDIHDLPRDTPLPSSRGNPRGDGPFPLPSSRGNPRGDGPFPLPSSRGNPRGEGPFPLPSSRGNPRGDGPLPSSRGYPRNDGPLPLPSYRGNPRRQAWQ